tara:strand:+ start:421 stop:1143 length:723 start_codon:yes stop_codon:yes gene_type:complete
MPTITASTNGGYIIANNHSSHANARNADTGNTVITQASRAQNTFTYQRAAGRSGTAYAIYRSFLQFDTSGITSTVSSATLKIQGYVNGNADIIIVKSSAFGSGYEGSTLSTADYDAITGFTDDQDMNGNVTDYSSEITTWSTSGYNDITLNSTALTDMQNDNAFKIAIINHDHDYKNVDPGINATNAGGMYFEAYTGTETDPIIEYTLAGYGNDVIGVASSNIAKVIGIATGDIEKIIGI